MILTILVKIEINLLLSPLLFVLKHTGIGLISLKKRKLDEETGWGLKAQGIR